MLLQRIIAPIFDFLYPKHPHGNDRLLPSNARPGCLQPTPSLCVVATRCWLCAYQSCQWARDSCPGQWCGCHGGLLNAACHSSTVRRCSTPSRRQVPRQPTWLIYTSSIPIESCLGQRHDLQSLTLISFFLLKYLSKTGIYIFSWKYFSRQIYSYGFHIFKLNNLKVI